MTDETNQGSQTEGSQNEVVEEKDTSLTDAYQAFGLTPPKKEETKQDEQPPTKEEQSPAGEAEIKKGITVKYNKEEKFVSDDELPSYVQKGLNYDKMSGKVSELEKNLDRVAKLSGYKDHADFIANIDKLEQQAKQRETDQVKQMRADIRQQAEDAGLDPEQVEAWIDGHPLVKQAEEAVRKAQEQEQQFTQKQQQEVTVQKWNELFTKYPDLTKEKVEDGELPSWYSPEMDSLVNRGYDPMHAYELVYRDSLIEDTKKKTEQKVIKDQMLGKRSQVETKPEVDPEPEVPENLKSAFSAFGLDPKRAKKYVNK